MQSAGRQRHLLEKARERGYLDTGRRSLNELELEFGRWCWKLRQPFVVVTRQSVYSRYSILRLDLCGTPNMLNTAGRKCIQQLMEQSGAKQIGDSNEVHGVWGHVENSLVATIAREVYKIATTLGYYQPDFELYEKRQQEYATKLGLLAPRPMAKSAKV